MSDRSDRASVNVLIDADVKKAAQKRAIDEGVTLTEAVERFFKAWTTGQIELPREEAGA